MNAHKNDLGSLAVRQLLSRRRALAARLGDVEQVLAGSLAEQTRRCGKAGCRCAAGEGHGPYAYFTPRPAGRGRARYVPAALADVVRGYLRRGEQAEAVLAEVSAIHAELLAPRGLCLAMTAALRGGPARAPARGAGVNATISGVGGSGGM